MDVHNIVDSGTLISTPLNTITDNGDGTFDLIFDDPVDSTGLDWQVGHAILDETLQDGSQYFVVNSNQSRTPQPL